MKKQIRITKVFKFEMAHALHGYDGLCKNIHGHSYKLYVTVIGKPINDMNHAKNGMVIDFKDLKTIVKSEIVDVFDHAMVLNNNSPHSELATVLSKQEHKVVRVDYQPTCENMVIDFANRITSMLPSHIKLFKVRLNETATAYAEWYAKDQE